jgi:hypothetical protein
MAFSYEGRLSFGFEYGNFWENRTDDGIDFKTYISSPGIALSSFHFWDNFGFFFNNSFLFPNNIETNIDGYDYGFMYNFIIGPAFKIAFTPKMDMALGVGFSLGPVVGEPTTLFNVGMGGNICVSYFINKFVYISIGSTLSYHFWNLSSTGTGTYDYEGDEIDRSVYSKNYSMFGVRPYIGMGFSLSFGKDKR